MYCWLHFEFYRAHYHPCITFSKYWNNTNPTVGKLFEIRKSPVPLTCVNRTSVVQEQNYTAELRIVQTPILYKKFKFSGSERNCIGETMKLSFPQIIHLVFIISAKKILPTKQQDSILHSTTYFVSYILCYCLVSFQISI